MCWCGCCIVCVGEVWYFGVFLFILMYVLVMVEVLCVVDFGCCGYIVEFVWECVECCVEVLWGGFDVGEVVYVGWSVIDVDVVDVGGFFGLFVVVDGVLFVCWSIVGGFMFLEVYLCECVLLLLDFVVG